MKRSRIAAEDGFTILEVLFAALVLLFVVASGVLLLGHGENSSLSVQRESQLISVADRQMESIRQAVKTNGFADLFMASAPAPTAIDATTTNQKYPSAFTKSNSSCGAGSEFAIQMNYNNTAEGSPSSLNPWSGCDTGYEPLTVISGYASNALLSPIVATPVQTSVAIGSGTATVTTFVTDTYVGCNSSLSNSTASCPTVNATSGQISGCVFPTATVPTTTCSDARRVTVAVAFNNTSGSPISPVYISTIFTNPAPANAPQTSSLGLTLGLTLG